MPYDSDACRQDNQHLAAWSIEPYVTDVFGRRLLMGYFATGGHSEPVECSDDEAADLRLLRLWIDMEAMAEEIGLDLKTTRPKFGADPTRVSVTLDGDTLASAKCCRESGPFVAYNLISTVRLEVMVEDATPEALAPEIRWGLTHGAA